MDDMVGKLMEMLNNPENMEKVKNLTGMLGKPEASNDDIKTDEPSEEPEIPVDAINAIMKIMPIISSMKQDDEKTHFLFALKPLLSDSRQHKLDESVKLMQMMKVLPLLKNQGIF